MRDKTLNDLITEAQSVLDQIAGHDEFVKILESGLWDGPTVSLIDARQSLEDLRDVYSSISQSMCVGSTEQGIEENQS
jgi:hypothetical protein